MFRLSLPPVRKDDSRQRTRRPARGLTLSCTRVASSRLHQGALRNLAVEVRDIGPGGLRFVSSEPLAAPASLQLHLRRDATGDALHARGDVAWTRTRRVDGRDEHVVGVRFEQILAPSETQARFFADAAPGPASTRPRAGRRFRLSDCDVTLERDHRFRGKEGGGNLAIRLLDVSRAGARVATTEPLKRGDRMRLTLNLLSFQDLFTAEAEAVWATPDRAAGASAWSVGLSFGSLSPGQVRKLAALESWFSGSRPSGGGTADVPKF